MIERKTNRKRKVRPPHRPARLGKKRQAITYAVRFPREVADTIEKMAADEDVTASEIIRRLVGEALGQEVRVTAYRQSVEPED